MATYYDGKDRYVYALQHKVTKRIYVGKSVNVQSRIHNHISLLKNRRHTNELMQEDVDKYGCEFDYYILDTIHEISEACKEHEWMDKLNTGDKRCGYNYKDVHFRNRIQPVEFTEGVPTPNPIDK